MTKNIEQKIFDEIRTAFEVEEDELKRKLSFSKDISISMLDLNDFLAHIENKFGITIPSEETESIETAGQLVDIVENAVEEL